jgi:hypothetical protein
MNVWSPVFLLRPPPLFVDVALTMRLSTRLSRKVTFSSVVFLLVALFAPDAGAAERREAAPRFYPGIGEEQSMRAHDALRAFHNGNFRRAERFLREMDRIEARDSLAPLSRLLTVAMAGLYLQRDDAGNAAEKARLGALLDSSAREGLAACKGRSKADVTCALIRGGIDGFRAVLKLHVVSPVQVLKEGLAAVSVLEKGIATDSSLKDAYMGIGIFHCTAAGNAPRVVRSMLSAVGRKVDYEDGLEYLRRSAYEGQYTSTASQLYLIQFLSPYDLELRREKIEILRTLQEVYPLSPYYPFLRWQEALAFYPDSFFNAPRLKTSLERRMRAMETRDYAAERYLNLLKHQYTLLNPKPAAQYAPDTTFDLGGYAFYPAFIEAVRLRRELRAQPAGPEREKKLADLRERKKKLLAEVKRADLNPSNRQLYQWHVQDALRDP